MDNYVKMVISIGLFQSLLCQKTTQRFGRTMYQYSELVKLTTSYARRMNKLSLRIFGEVTRDTNIPSMKVERLMAKQPDNKNPEKMVCYYPRHVETGLLMMKLRDYGLFRDEHQDFKEEMKRLRALRGKHKYSVAIDGWPEGFVRKRKQKKTEE